MEIKQDLMKKKNQLFSLFAFIHIFNITIGNATEKHHDLEESHYKHANKNKSSDHEDHQTNPIINNKFIDLDENISDFILEETQIKIPGYPDAFNPSIIPWNKDTLLLSFRTRDPKTKVANLIGFVILDKDFQPIEKPTLLNIYGEKNLTISKAQGPRLIQFNDRPYTEKT